MQKQLELSTTVLVQPLELQRRPLFCLSSARFLWYSRSTACKGRSRMQKPTQMNLKSATNNLQVCAMRLNFVSRREPPHWNNARSNYKLFQVLRAQSHLYRIYIR